MEILCMLSYQRTNLLKFKEKGNKLVEEALGIRVRYT